MIELKLNSSNKKAIIDDIHYDRVSSFEGGWMLATNGYAVSVIKYGEKQLRYYLHKFILNVHQDPKILIDHIDRNRLNCLESNLRRATCGENIVNRVKYGKYTSKYKGVSWHKASNRWQSCITFNDKQVYGGLFEQESDAALKSNELYLKYFGEFAVLNNIL